MSQFAVISVWNCGKWWRHTPYEAETMTSQHPRFQNVFTANWDIALKNDFQYSNLVFMLNLIWCRRSVLVASRPVSSRPVGKWMSWLSCRQFVLSSKCLCDEISFRQSALSVVSWWQVVLSAKCHGGQLSFNKTNDKSALHNKTIWKFLK